MASVLKSEMKVGLPVSVWKYDQFGESDEHVDTGIVCDIQYRDGYLVAVEVECTVDFGGYQTEGQKCWYPLCAYKVIHDRENV